MQIQTIKEFESVANEIISSKKWESATEHLSLMNRRLIENLAKGKTENLSETILDYIPHALEQGKQALKRR